MCVHRFLEIFRVSHFSNFSWLFQIFSLILENSLLLKNTIFLSKLIKVPLDVCSQIPWIFMVSHYLRLFMNFKWLHIFFFFFFSFFLQNHPWYFLIHVIHWCFKMCVIRFIKFFRLCFPIFSSADFFEVAEL